MFYRRLMMNPLFSALVAFAGVTSAWANGPKPIPLWANGAAGSEARKLEPEKVDEGPGKCNVSNVHNLQSPPTFRQPTKPLGQPLSLLPAEGTECCVLGMREMR